MISFIVGVLVLIAIGLLVFGVWLFKNRHFGLGGKMIYGDAPELNGETLYAKDLLLMGRPDYLIKTNGLVIPVEIKSSRTPKYPYNNHIAQITAYCILVEDNFGVMPPYGVIKYPDREFRVEFSEQNKKVVLNR